MENQPQNPEFRINPENFYPGVWLKQKALRCDCIYNIEIVLEIWVSVVYSFYSLLSIPRTPRDWSKCVKIR